MTQAHTLGLSQGCAPIFLLLNCKLTTRPCNNSPA
uniref:Uncharacterized protein n=1 Tax=Rhizophora mucronata TaxID=61149 RepID=A0A2P2PUC5_RHIMU